MKLHLLFAVCLLGAACGDSGGGTADASNDGMIGCKNDPLAETYTANMMAPGANHNLTFVLASGNPAPPARYNNTWHIKLLDAQNQPVTGATITATPFMPRHGHGTSIVPTVTPSADGYDVGILYFFMAGLWQVTLQVTQSSAGADTAVFSFCVEG